ncbi:MAG: Fic family protein [Nitriliruptor sp.]|uniref:Fic family protein n=1 Tax=Nitriliruptor sp. TaxID=2448056 RepID=UPI0034A010AE
MDVEAFTSDRLGAVRKTIDGHHAFHPGPVPREVDYDATTVNKLTEATAAVHRLAGVSRLLPSPDILMGPYVRIEAVLSSKIEGTQTSVGELLLFEADHDVNVPPEGDLREVVNYTHALDHALRALDRLPLSLRLIRETHAILMSGVRGEAMTPGEFRRTQNWIGPPGSTLTSAKFVPPPVDAMHEALADLERFLHEHQLPNLVALALAHYQFETIHPFLDGNGRIGRLLVPLALCERGVLERPMLYLSAYFERHRSQYYHLLFETSATGDPTPWINFFLDGVAHQSRDAEERTVRLVDLQRDIREELLTARVTNTTVRLAESLLDRPYVTAKRLTGQLNVTLPTAQKAIDALVDQDILTEVTGKKRNRVYLSPRIMDAVYGIGDEEHRVAP